MKILLIDTVHPAMKNLLTEAGYKLHDGSLLSREEILQSIADYEGIILRSRIQVDKNVIQRAANLRFIGRVGSGMEHIDVQYAESKGVACLSSPEGNRDAVGEHAIGMLLSLFNNLVRSDEQVKSGIWSREPNRGTELYGKTVALIGYGRMGSAFAKKLSGFDCKVIAYDKYRQNFSDQYAKECTMAEIFDEADVLSLHVPLTKETEYLVNEEYIGRFRKNIYIVNTARGKCLNTFDLANMLKSGKVAGACLDTLEYEESSFESVQDLHARLQPLLEFSDRIILSPHIAGWTHESNEKLATVLAQKIIRQFPV